MSREQKKSRILIVDDEPDILNSLRMGIERRGYAVDAFVDPLAALAQFAPSKYSLCIIDIRMPVMNGFEMYREIKKIDQCVRVCFCTAHDREYREEFRKAFPELDQDSFIPKPATLTMLVCRIEEELGSLNAALAKNLS